MHHVKIDNTHFNYNSDLSGDVHISSETDANCQVVIPGKTLLAFAARWIRIQRISELEDMADSEVLGIQAAPKHT